MVCFYEVFQVFNSLVRRWFKFYCVIDILKHSDKNNPDHQALVSALASIREVMTHINEDKRKTEGQVALFDIFNDIDNCPVSSL